MTKLHQILAVDRGVRTRNYAAIGEVYKLIQKTDLVSGKTRVYRKKDDDGEDFPSEQHLVQVRVPDALQEIAALTSRMWDIAATKEWSNTEARANIVLEGDTTPILEAVPVGYLLFLEKQLSDIHAIAMKLPLLDPTKSWSWDASSDCWRSGVESQHRNKKVPKAFVKAPATEKHPAQVEMFTEDVLVGFWDVTYFSGAIGAQDRKALIERVERLQRAVKMAREAANDREVEDPRPARALLDFLLPKVPSASTEG